MLLHAVSFFISLVHFPIKNDKVSATSVILNYVVLNYGMTNVRYFKATEKIRYFLLKRRESVA